MRVGTFEEDDVSWHSFHVSDVTNYIGFIERPLLAVSVAFALLKLSLECKL